MESLKERLKEYYGLSEEAFQAYSKEPSFSLVPRIDEEPSVKEGLALIKAALTARQKILIYGDYDGDGILSTSILVRCFLRLRRHVEFFIPSRYLDGYGLTMENAEKIVKAGYGLVILVDNGVSCFEQVAYLRQHGVNVLIIDHHELPSSLPPANALIHDGLLKYGSARISAGCLCFLFSLPMLGEVDPYLLTLGAMSLITDMMPMKGQNRLLVALALREIRKREFPEIMMLTKKKLIDEKTLGHEIGPKINAICRIKKEHEGKKLVHYFADFEGKDKFKTAAYMEMINDARKKMGNEAEEKLTIEESAPGIIVLTNLLEGLNGLLAGRLMNKYERPALVLSPSSSQKGCLVGSFRCEEGASFLGLQEVLEPYLLHSGGHRFAGGLTIKQSDFEEVRKIFLSYCREHPHAKKEERSILLFTDEISLDSYRLIRSLGPFGHDYEEPKFRLENLPSAMLGFIKNGQYMKTELPNGSAMLSFKLSRDLLDGNPVSLLGTMRLNEFNGTVSVEFVGDPIQK